MKEGWGHFIKSNPWPAAILAICAVWYLTNGYATKDDLKESEERTRKHIELHHPTMDTKVEVHGNSIETLFRDGDRREKDIRELRGEHR